MKRYGEDHLQCSSGPPAGQLVIHITLEAEESPSPCGGLGRCTSVYICRADHKSHWSCGKAADPSSAVSGVDAHWGGSVCKCLSLLGFDFYFRCIDSVISAPEARRDLLQSHLSFTKQSTGPGAFARWHQKLWMLYINTHMHVNTWNSPRTERKLRSSTIISSL